MSRALYVIASVAVVGVACGGAAPAASSATSEAPAAVDKVPDAPPPPAGPPKDLDCGDFTTCAVTTEGAVRCWGRDKTGELGDGGGKEHPKIVAVPGLEKVKKLALAAQFGCALLEDKKVKCWGSGRIANDGKSYTNAKPMVVSGIDGAEELVASGVIACARTASGVTCWGADASTIGSPPSGAFENVAAGFTHACALDKSGAPQCWGMGDWSPKGAFSKPAIKGATQIVTGDRHACVVAKDKTVQCWGSNDAGQLGTKSDSEAHKKPLAVPGVKDVVKLSVGEASTCALSGDGTVRCWGANGEGELGLGRRSADERPQSVSSISGVGQLCLASTHACALTKQSRITCWGANAVGQLGDGTKERRLEPVVVAW